MHAIKSFRDLDVWKVAMDLAVACYDLAGFLPSAERFELGAQIRRAAVSIPSNVAEGHSTGASRRYANHVRIALGSAGELATLLELTRRRGLQLAGQHAVEEQLTRTVQLLHGVRRSLRRTKFRTADDR